MTDLSPVSAMARIIAADVFLIEAALISPYKLSFGAQFAARAVMLKLTDADGFVGWGEANPNKFFTDDSPEEAAQALENTLLPAVLVCPAPEPGRIDAELDALMPRQLCAKGAVSMALLDLLGKRLRVPVSTLLGGSLRSSLPVLWPLSNGSAEEDIPVIEERAEQGFTSFMLKMGTSPIADEVRRVATLEARYGERIKFIADANQGWSRDDARNFLKEVGSSALAFVEQPLAKDDVEGMAILARDSELPLSADESARGLEEIAKVARLGAASIVSIKSSKNGGPLRAQRIAAVAKAFGMHCYMNSMLEFGITQAASLQHAVTLDNLVDVGHAFMSTLRMKEDPTGFSSFVKKGVIHLPDRAGLGLEVDEQHVRRLTVGSTRLSTH